MTHLLADLGWVDLDLGCSTGHWAVLQMRCCPSKTVEHPKFKSTQPSPRGDGSPCILCMLLFSYKKRAMAYRVSHVLVDQGWVDFDLGVPPFCPAPQTHLPNSHQPRQNWADSGTLKIQVNPTQSSRIWDTLYRVTHQVESYILLTSIWGVPPPGL